MWRCIPNRIKGLFLLILYLSSSVVNAESADKRWSDASERLAAGNTLEAAIALTELIDDYPETEYAQAAYEAFVSMAIEHENGVIPPEVVNAYSDRFPSIESVTAPEAKWVVIEHYSYECMLAFESGDVARGARIAESVRMQCRQVFHEHPNSQVAIGAVQRFTELSRELGEIQSKDATDELNALVLRPGYSVAKWASLFTLAWHIEFTGGNRKRLSQLRSQLFELSQHPSHLSLMAHPYPLYFIGVDCEYALGDAYMREGRHGEAIAHLDRAAAHPYQGTATELAHFKGARARHLDKPLDDEGALSRYAEHVQLFPESVRRGDAHFYMGQIHERHGRPEEALESYGHAIERSKRPELVDRATARRDHLRNK